MMPRTLIVPLDGSPFAERAIPVARALATQLDGRVVLLTARWDGEPPLAPDYLERVAAEHGAVDTMLIRDRRPAAAIALGADELAESIVCMTTHGRGRLRWSVLGSVAEDVVHASTRPVLLVGRHCREDWPNGFGTAVVCADGSSVDDPIIPIAAEWARQLGLRADVLQVLHPLDVEGATHSDPTIEAIVARLERDGVAAKSVTPRAEPIGGAIADHAATVPDALVMMSSSSRAGLARLALGSVAMATVSMSASPVLILRAPVTG